MSSYTAPLQDMRFVMHELAGLDEIAQLPGFEDASAESVDALLEAAARFAAEVLAPLNATGDREGACWHEGAVRMPRGFREAYAAIIAHGWNGIGCPPEFGGHRTPRLVTTAVREIWNAANMAFGLCFALNTGAVEALKASASPELQQRFLPQMISGAWTAAMALTEPQAGSDLSAIRSSAEPQADGTYRIHGRKIFITYGEHDLAGNIIHLVLARLPGAPPGTKGISLFLVPKVLVGPDGSLGARNDVHCVSIERKLGIHASPTCAMSFGEDNGAVGYLIGEPNRGLECMFVLMNDARLVSGLQGLGVAERAYQQALAYARTRIQGRDIGGGAESVPILRHPDVRRMLLLMKSQIEAMRALAYVVAAARDRAEGHPDPLVRARERAFAEFLTPVVKGWCTETGIEIASIGIQIHGGAGFIEETGAAQHLRDVRITAIYEGTTGIQANDLMGRKIVQDRGAAAAELIGRMQGTLVELQRAGGEDLAAIAEALGAGIAALERAVGHVLGNYSRAIHATAVGAVPLLRLVGIVSGGWLLGKGALTAHRRLASGMASAEHLEVRIAAGRFFADHVLAQAPGLAHTVERGAGRLMQLTDDQFDWLG